MFNFDKVIHLTKNKTEHIIETRDYEVTGFVLTNKDGSKCVIDMSAVRWFDDKNDFFRMMHPNN